MRPRNSRGIDSNNPCHGKTLVKDRFFLQILNSVIARKIPAIFLAQRRLKVCPRYKNPVLTRYTTSSVTRLGDILDFGQLFNASGSN